MNLSMSVLGWFHTAACVVAIAAMLWVVFTPKGTRLHRRVGQAFTLAILFAAVTSLGIYARHVWTFAHWFAVLAIVSAGGGWLVAHFKRPRRGWRYLHLTLMLVAAYDLIGGGVNEVYLRVKPLRHFWRDDYAVIGMTHGVVMMTFLSLIAVFLLATAIGPRLRSRAV
jgi:uncharacterized membrane protein